MYGDHYHWTLLETHDDAALEPTIYSGFGWLGSGWLDDFVAIVSEDAFSDATPRTLLSDEMGTVQALVSPSGAVLERYEYGPYGEQVVIDAPTGDVLPASAFGVLVGFQGHPSLGLGAGAGGAGASVQGLVEMRFRTYSPGMGRFLTRDPIGTADSLNKYQFGRDNPKTRLDTLGLFSLPNPSGAGCVSQTVELDHLIEQPIRTLLGMTPFSRTLGKIITKLLRSKFDARGEIEACLTPDCPPCATYRAAVVGEFNLVPTYKTKFASASAGIMVEAGGSMQCCGNAANGALMPVVGNCTGELYFCAGIFIDAHAHTGLSRTGLSGQAKACMFIPSGDLIVTGSVGGYHETLGFSGWTRTGFGGSFCYDGGSGRCAMSGGPTVAF